MGGNSMAKASPNQIEYLKNLGFKGGAKLTDAEASDKIDELLEPEKRTGCKLPCPLCGGIITKRPRFKKKCPHCGELLHHVCGKLVTPEQAAESRGAAMDARENWRGEVRMERDAEWFAMSREAAEMDIQFLRDNPDDFKGVRVSVGKACRAAAPVKHREFIPTARLIREPELLPPYPGVCRRETCECEFEEVPGKAQGLPAAPQSSGCVVVLLALVIVAALAASI
jgi:hypothetical protein